MQPKYQVVLFDVDGVLITPPKMFSDQYCEKYGVDKETQKQFYTTKEFRDASLGKFDLKDAIRLHNDKWQWHGAIDELLDMWFEGESYPNEPLLDIVEQLRAYDTKVYLATQQEKYRKAYLEKVVFKDKIDGLFCSCDMGYEKHDDDYWRTVIRELAINPQDIAFFDDKQNLVDLALRHGISAFLYKNVDQVSNQVFIA